LRSIAESRPTSLDVSRAASGFTLKTDSIIFNTNMPDPVPVVVLARLAVDRTFHAKGVGTGLFRDAVLRTLQAAEIAGVRAILLRAISEAAKRFYEKYGFIASPVDPMTVMITSAEAGRIIGGGS
jgi:predicted N-acetyltransferase YhbS